MGSTLASTLTSPGIAQLFGGRPGYLSLKGAAYYAGVSTRTVKRWIAQGLPDYQGTARGKVLIKPADIDAFLKKRTAPKVDLDTVVDEVLSGLKKKAA